MRNMKKILSFLLAFSMVLTLVPMPAEAEEVTCTHHIHDESCGFVEGKDCNHVHGEGCGDVTVTNCAHVHGTEGCTFVAGTPAVSCHPIHNEDCGYVAGVACECDLSEGREHLENCGYVAEVSCKVTHEGCGCVAAVPASGECNHTCTDCVTTTFVCAHTAHDKDCGYVEAKPCTFDPAACEACKVIANQSADWCGNPLCSQEDNAHAPACTQYVRTYEGCKCVLSCAVEGLNEYCETCYFEGVEACTGGEEEQIVYVTSGVTGDCTWTFDDATGTLTISGNGAIGKNLGDEGLNIATTIVIQDGVTSIGNYAFRGFTSLENVSIPGSVTTIGNYAFNGCSSLESVSIPGGVTRIGNAAFYGCSSLTTVAYEGIADPAAGRNVFIGTGVSVVEVPAGYMGDTFCGLPVTRNNPAESTTYPVTVANDGNGTASADPTSAAAGTEVTLTATPNSGYTFKEWQVTPSTVTITDNKFTMPESNVEIKAVFEKIAEYPVWVQGTQITSENMADVLGDGTVSYDPATFTLTLNNASISSTESGQAAIHSLYQEHTLKIVGIGTNTIIASGGSGIYANKQNISISGGTFLISGSTNGICSESGSVTIENAQVKSVGTTGYGVFAKDQLSVTNGGLLSVSGNNAVVRGSYTMSDETFAELGVAENAVLTISEGATVTVTENITSSGTIQINGTLKVPAGSGRNTMSGGILYIGDKGFQWVKTGDQGDYYCFDNEHVWNTDKPAKCTACPAVRPAGSGTVTLDDWVYGTPKNPVAESETNGNGNVTYRYKKQGETAFTDTQPTDVGKYTVRAIFPATDAYEEAVAEDDFEITAKSLENAEVTLSAAVVFGSQKPTVTVKDGEKELTAGTDYTVAEVSEDGIEMTVVVEGKGNYKDFATAKPVYLVVTLPDPKDVEPDNVEAIEAYETYAKYNETYGDSTLRKLLEELHKALTAYDIVKGHKSSYVKGSYKKLSFTANGYFGKFTGVEVDGKLIDAKYYTAESGSTIITLKPSYLESLNAGKHTIQVNYTDGNTGGEEYFRITVNNGSPFTGDNSHMMLFGGMALTSLLCMAMLIVFFPRKKGKYQR